MGMQIFNIDKCTGCYACSNVCPNNCITLLPMEPLGHILPQIDRNSCVDCGLCRKVCPLEVPIMKKEPIEVFASWSLDEKIRETSTSGGLATHIAMHYIKNGGVVYGCSSSIEKGEIGFVRVTNAKEVENLKGSKYVHSFIKDSYKDCKKDLEDGNKVLFIALPCQIAGLKSFLRQEWSNLLTIDLICHGGASQQLFFEDIKNLKIGNKKWVSFRDKEKVNLTIRGENDSVKISNYQDLYTIAFFKNLIFRESCYNCDYAQELRIGDLTLGDFWGLGKETPFCGDVKDGVSLVLINTEKGKKLFHYLFAEKELFAEKRSMQEAKKGNPNLEKATVKNQYYEKFYKLYKNYGLKRSMQKLFWLDLIKYRAFEIVMKIIKK